MILGLHAAIKEKAGNEQLQRLAKHPQPFIGEARDEATKLPHSHEYPPC